MQIFERELFLRIALVVLIVFTISTNAFAVIIERQSMRDMAPLISQGTLVVFDIDNTLIQQAQTLGSDQWFSYVLKQYTDKGMTKEAALAKTSGFWQQINYETGVLPVEPQTPAFLRRLQDAGLIVVGLTSRNAMFVDITERQLHDVQIDFSRSPISGRSDMAIDTVRYYHGVLMTTGQNKGESLLKFLNRFQLHPQKVVFVDDILGNVQKMEDALTKANIPVVNVRYGALDARVRAFNPKIPLVEWGIFSKYHRLISDDAALRIINSENQ